MVTHDCLLLSFLRLYLLFFLFLVLLAARYLFGPMRKREQTQQYQLHHL